MGEILHFPYRQEWGLKEDGTERLWHYWVKWPPASELPKVLRKNGYEPRLVLPPTSEWLELGQVDRLDGGEEGVTSLRKAAQPVFERFLYSDSVLSEARQGLLLCPQVRIRRASYRGGLVLGVEGAGD